MFHTSHLCIFIPNTVQMLYKSIYEHNALQSRQHKVTNHHSVFKNRLLWGSMNVKCDKHLRFGHSEWIQKIYIVYSFILRFRAISVMKIRFYYNQNCNSFDSLTAAIKKVNSWMVILTELVKLVRMADQSNTN